MPLAAIELPGDRRRLDERECCICEGAGLDNGTGPIGLQRSCTYAADMRDAANPPGFFIGVRSSFQTPSQVSGKATSCCMCYEPRNWDQRTGSRSRGV
jgi:hypothetical protein